MPAIDDILAALTDREVARVVDIPFQEAYNRFAVSSVIVASWPEYLERIGSFYDHMFTHCVVKGAHRSRDDAVQQASRILEHEFRREGGLTGVYRRALTGTDHALIASLEKIFESMKNEATENYVRTVFLRHFCPAEWTEKQEIARQLCERLGPELAPELHRESPAALAHDVETLINACTQARRYIAQALRRY